MRQQIGILSGDQIKQKQFERVYVVEGFDAVVYVLLAQPLAVAGMLVGHCIFSFFWRFAPRQSFLSGFY